MSVSKDETEKKRLRRVTPGKVKCSHLCVNEHYDFFPCDCIGGANRTASDRSIEMYLDGLDQMVMTGTG